VGKRFRHGNNTAVRPECDLGSKCSLRTIGDEVVEAGEPCDRNSAVAGCQGLERGAELCAQP